MIKNLDLDEKTAIIISLRHPLSVCPNYTAKKHAKDSFNALIQLLTQEPTPVQKIWEMNTCLRLKQKLY